MNDAWERILLRTAQAASEWFERVEYTRYLHDVGSGHLSTQDEERIAEDDALKLDQLEAAVVAYRTALALYGATK